MWGHRVKDDLPGPGYRWAQLRDTFDEIFSQPPPAPAEAAEDLLAIEVAGQAYAVRLSEVAGLASSRKIVPLPSPASDLMGVMGFRGSVIPVYSLRSVLGYPAVEDLRWLLLAKAGGLLGLAFDRYEGHLRVSRTDFAEPELSGATPHHVREVARTRGGLRAVLSISSLLQALKG
jgi:purine-binding chemotaxis protein CheW